MSQPHSLFHYLTHIRDDFGMIEIDDTDGQPSEGGDGDEDSIEMRGKRHSDETRAAVMAALLAGQGVMEVAKKYNLPHADISRWCAEIPKEQLDEVGRKKDRDFGSLLGDYLEANLKALKVQAEVASEPEYIREQPANELAVLHGVLADKGIRLLEAAQAAADRAEDHDAGDAA